MVCDGLEIDMLSVKDADCVLVTRWYSDRAAPKRVLIDGGHKEDAEIIGAFLTQRKIDRLSHVVCTHPHDDHSGGLIELLKDHDLKVGRAWMHVPENHVDRAVVDVALSKSVNIREASIMRKSLDDADDLQEVLRRRGTPISEPFEGDKIGFLTVCGPSLAYYRELVSKFEDVDEIKRVTTTIRRQAELLKAMTNSALPGGEALLDEPEEKPINNSSVILGTKFGGGTYLFTADAGVQALTKASEAYTLEDCSWMQIPHHGSWRNINQRLIDLFAPAQVMVSAAGNEKHPRQAVVRAFKSRGTCVFGTHVSGHLWLSRGTVPERSGYAPAKLL